MNKFFSTTAQGYEVLETMEARDGVTIALISRGHDYVVAWAYDTKSGTWGQGHYYDDLKKASKKFNEYMR